MPPDSNPGSQGAWTHADDAMRRSHGPLESPDRITIVSGLPRSGTSLLMQLLGAAGLELAQDTARPPDADNPRGFFELEAARRLRAGSGFLEGCRGRVVKVVAPLVLDLDPALGLRLLFIERDLDEVLASQRAMLTRRGESWRAEQEAALRRAFEGVVARCRVRFAGVPETPALFVSHSALVHSPEAAIEQIVDFLAATAAGPDGAGLDGFRPEQAAAVRAALRAVIEPSLHRQRRAGGRDR